MNGTAMNRVEKAPFWITASEFAANYRMRITGAVLFGLILWHLSRGNLPRHIATLAEPLGIAATGLILAGLALRSWASGTLRKGQALTTYGPYRLCRHPLYLASVLIMTGFCLMIPDLVSSLVMLGVVGAVYWLTIVREERRLAIKYGDDWKNYTATTPRLLPVGLSPQLVGQWSFAQWYRSREHRALFAAPLAITALELWRAFS
jgi:protein-S-isoprenylcysteine O-methyltransferase Ste14